MLVHRLRGLHVGKRGLGVCGCRGERGITSGGASEAIEVVWESSLGKSDGNSAKRVVKSYSLPPSGSPKHKALVLGAALEHSMRTLDGSCGCI